MCIGRRLLISISVSCASSSHLKCVWQRKSRFEGVREKLSCCCISQIYFFSLIKLLENDYRHRGRLWFGLNFKYTWDDFFLSLSLRLFAFRGNICCKCANLMKAKSVFLEQKKRDRLRGKRNLICFLKLCWKENNYRVGCWAISCEAVGVLICKDVGCINDVLEKIRSSFNFFLCY